MIRIKPVFRRVPGWLVLSVIAAGLYFTGTHTEVIGQLQRVILATGLIRPPLPASAARGAKKPSPETAIPADYQLLLRSLAGEEVPISRFRGKVVFMNFWATWCPPCVAEMPNIQSLYDRVQSGKIVFVMVSVDREPGKAAAFIRRKGFTFPVYQLAGPLPPVYAGQVIPTTFVISPAGKIVVRKEGMADYDSKKFRRFLLDLARPPL